MSRRKGGLYDYCDECGHAYSNHEADGRCCMVRVDCDDDVVGVCACRKFK